MARFLNGNRFMDMRQFTLEQVRASLLNLPQDFGLDKHQRGKGEMKHLVGTYYDEHGAIRRPDGSEVTSEKEP